MLLFHFDVKQFLIIDIHEQQSIHRNPLYKIAKGTHRKNAVSILPKHHQSRNAKNINPNLMVFTCSDTLASNLQNSTKY